MSLNPSTQSLSAVDVIDGTVSEFYNLMDQCIRKSEVMPGQYKSITSPSYSNNCPITESSFTTIDVGCPAPQVVDINNSFITANVKVKINFPAATFKTSDDATTFFVGWRSSLDVLSRYIIYCNHKVVYDQIYVGEESYILQSLIPEHVRCRRPNQYTTYENAHNLSPNVCGTYISLHSADDSTNMDAKTVEVNIPIKLDINQFLLFQNFKYLPGFCGTWSIKLYPAVQNMIICPVNPALGLTAAHLGAIIAKGCDLNQHDHHFVQIGDKIKCYTQIKTSSAGNEVVTAAVVQGITADKLTLENVLYHQTQFELMYDVYDALKARYLARPLTIPVNKLDYGRFAGNINGGASGQTSSTYTAAVSNVESIFILPFHDDNHHTVCQNPNFKNFYLSISGFGNYPQQPFNTGGNDDDHIRFLNMTLDALNINNSPIAAPNKDLMNSLESKQTTIYKEDGTVLATTINDNRHDKSNFLIGLPFSNDIDFQGGLTSNGNINLKLSATNSDINTIGQALNSSNCSIGATVMFCCDCALLIKVVPYADQPECRLICERVV